jgi:hypothetical protein
LAPEPEAKTFVLDSEEKPGAEKVTESEESISPDDIPFEVNGEEHQSDDTNVFTLKEEPEQADESIMADAKKRRRKKEKRSWVQSTLGGLFEDKTKNN